MNQESPNETQLTIKEQTIKTIGSNFQKIKTSIINEFPKIPKGSTVLIFIGQFENKFDSFYSHLENKSVILDTQHLRIVQIVGNAQKNKIAYLLHFPLMLLYDEKNDEIVQNFCISKINAEKALQKIKQCDFQVILDIQQLRGDDDNAKLKTVVLDSILYFGTKYFTEDYFFLFRYQGEDKWDCSLSQKTKGMFSFFSNDEKLQVSTYSQHEILQVILNSKKKLELKMVQSEDEINYGKMMTYLQQQYDLLKKLLNDDLKHFQNILLLIQQMPIIKNNCVAQEVKDYLNELTSCLNTQDTKLFNISQVYKQINIVNQGQNAQKIKARLSNKLSPQMKLFIQEKNIEQLQIQPLLSNELLEILKKIIEFFSCYHNSELKDENMSEVAQLKFILQSWCMICDPKIENSLYELNNITNKVQSEPKNDIENGIFFIGATKSGKSTIINSLLNPENIIQEDFLSQKCYGVKQKTKFTIGSSGASQTQNINGVYIGKKQELDQIFDQKEQNVFSYEEILDQEQMKNCKIPQNWFIFDCPGFDDNINELMRISHRISLSNYIKKTKNIIVYFVIDFSQQSLQNIKNTFDPIIQLLKDKNDLETHFEKWTNIVLTKAEEGQRDQFIKNWEVAYEGHLDDDYSFYKKLFEYRSIEFKKQLPNIREYICNLADQIIKMSQQQLANQQQYQPKFQNILDDKVWSLFEHCIPKFNSKLDSIIDLLIMEVNFFVLESNVGVSKKQQKIEKIKSILTQKGKEMITVITSKNCKTILEELSEWTKDIRDLKQGKTFLQQFIDDSKCILEISNQCQNTSIAPFEVKIDKLVIRIKTAITSIKKTILYYNCWSYGGYAVSLIAALMSGGSSLALCEVKVFVTLARKFLLTRGILWGISLTSGSVSSISFIYAFIDKWKNDHLRKIYKEALNKENDIGRA
ncbi:unnamed protein product [Paramecium octaurelia]|uniref:Dynamin N-terminal domain-containing protein n=1 Tax=Paramecium octaurelia TaxID=43137 RepID=A0A8S1WB89_PAROT|nr:unnamed protein product [Paramecium octaurelia]